MRLQKIGAPKHTPTRRQRIKQKRRLQSQLRRADRKFLVAQKFGFTNVPEIGFNAVTHATGAMFEYIRQGKSFSQWLEANRQTVKTLNFFIKKTAPPLKESELKAAYERMRANYQKQKR